MKIRKVAVAAAVISCGMALWGLSWAQNVNFEQDAKQWKLREAKIAVEAQKAATKEAAKADAMAAIVAKTQEIRIRKAFPAPFGMPRHLTQIQEAAEQYCDAKDEADKAKALKHLNELASKYFEEDMDVRKKELTDIEARLDKLRTQLERRRAKKDEIVELQVKVAINEAEGLGFTSAPRDVFKYDFRGPVPVAAPAPVAFAQVAAPRIAPVAAPKIAEVMAAPPSSDFFSPPVRVEVAIPTPPSPPSGDPQSLSVGAKGDAVRLLQKALNEKLQSSPDLAIDGDFGPETDKAVKEFQAEHELEETGVVDEATRKKLELPAELPPFINSRIYKN